MQIIKTSLFFVVFFSFSAFPIEKIKKSIRTVSDKPIKFLINTHWHGGHVGGNQNFAQQQGVVIVAQRRINFFDYRI